MQSHYTKFFTGSIDFIYHEYLYSAYESIDSIYPPYGSSNFVVLSERQLPQEPRANKLSFNRISPFVHLYLEWFSRNKTFSFSLGSAYTFTSIYQLENTSEFYKCFKISPTTLGLTYHFKE